MPKTYFYYCDDYLSIATLPTDHPFWNIQRFELIYRLARFYRIFGEKVSLKEPPFAVWKDLTSFHNFQYAPMVDVVVAGIKERIFFKDGVIAYVSKN